MHFSIFLQTPSRTLSYRLASLRWMGGGPRTFPGGLNKWQWKRMHDKKAREKEKRLIDQEKQVYQARVRSQIRANLESSENPGPVQEKTDTNPPNYKPLSPQEHIKALADRFKKEGAEDLWNEADGPLDIPEAQSGKVGTPIDLEKLIAKKGGLVGGRLITSRSFSTHTSGFDLVNNSGSGILMDVSGMLNLRRFYSVSVASAVSKKVNFVKNGPSSVTGDVSNTKKLGSVKKAQWPKFRKTKMDSSDDDSDDYEDEEEEGGKIGSSGNDIRKKYGSSAALGKYDIKRKKRIPLKFLEREIDLSEQVEEIKKEFEKRNITKEDEDNVAEEETIFSTKRFDDCGVSSLTVQALTEAGYVQMTNVQEATLAACLEGKDVLVKARAGTGKSIAFLLPAIETVLKASRETKVPRVPPIYVLILCPTRELASQISAEAKVLLKHHHHIGVQTLVGGTRFKVDQRLLETDPCQIVVATPGRLLDHIENKSGISLRLMGLKMVVVDEADNLLDLGFRKDMETIVDCLPRSRQSLLFSTTLPKEVRRVSQLVLTREHVYIDTLGIGNLETHSKVQQFYHVAPHDRHLQIVHHLIKSHMSQVPDYKVIVFCVTAMMTELMCSLLREMKLNVREIHSLKPTIYRTRISDEFKNSKEVILVTSDVISHGMNYPDVTLVIQVGIPTDRGQYIHRLGRTGRQDKEGVGFLLVAPWEQYFLDNDLKDLPLMKSPVPCLDPDMEVKIEKSMGRIDTSIKEAAYHAWLGYYNSIRPIGRDKTSLVEFANKFAASLGLEKPPALFRKTAIKMGLKDIAGIRIRK